jgi:phosphohistidine phosphatase
MLNSLIVAEWGSGMKLYLVRHGIAEDGHQGLPDEERQLTPEGRAKLKEIFRLARGAGVQPTLILSSPLVRAVQTAEIAAGELSYKKPIGQVRSLAPDANPRDTWEDIRVHKSESELLLTSHNPLCASIAAYLLGAPELNVDYKKGAIMRIDFDSFSTQPQGVLRWFAVPALAS